MAEDVLALAVDAPGASASSSAGGAGGFAADREQQKLAHTMPVGSFRHNEEAPEHGLWFHEYRHHEHWLDERKLKGQHYLSLNQTDHAVALHRQDRRLDDHLHQQSSQLARALLTHRPGFERPSAALGVFEQRSGPAEEKYKQFREAQIAHQHAKKRWDRKYTHRMNFDLKRAAVFHEETREVEELKKRMEDLKVEIMADASQDQKYGDHLKVHPDEMQAKQRDLFKNLQRTQAKISQEAEEHRKEAADLRMKGIIQMQQNQRALRHHMELETGHERLRLMKVAERSKEQHRALSLGTPHWTYPRPRAF